jgi:hypothetical protein
MIEFNTVLLGYRFLELFAGTVPNDIQTEALTFISWAKILITR